MTDTPDSPTETRGIPAALIVVIGIALAAFTVLVLIEANKKTLNLQEGSLMAGSAETLATLGKLEESAEVYTELLERSGNESQFATYHLNRANLRYRQGQYEEALEDYRTAIELDKEGLLYQARWNLGQAWARLGETEKAEAAFLAFQEEYGEELPRFARRAEHAIALLNK